MPSSLPPASHPVCSCAPVPVEVVGPVGRAGAKALHAWCSALYTLLSLMKASTQQQQQQQQPEQQQPEEHQPEQQPEEQDAAQASPPPNLELSSSSIADDLPSPHTGTLCQERDANDAGANTAHDA
jgi:hypothetical protein